MKFSTEKETDLIAHFASTQKVYECWDNLLTRQQQFKTPRPLQIKRCCTHLFTKSLQASYVLAWLHVFPPQFVVVSMFGTNFALNNSVAGHL